MAKTPGRIAHEIVTGTKSLMAMSERIEATLIEAYNQGLIDAFNRVVELRDGYAQQRIAVARAAANEILSEIQKLRREQP